MLFRQSLEMELNRKVYDKELYEKIGISKMCLWRVLNGKGISMRNLKKISDVIETKPEDYEY